MHFFLHPFMTGFVERQSIVLLICYICIISKPNIGRTLKNFVEFYKPFKNMLMISNLVYLCSQSMSPSEPVSESNHWGWLCKIISTPLRLFSNLWFATKANQTKVFYRNKRNASKKFSKNLFATSGIYLLSSSMSFWPTQVTIPPICSDLSEFWNTRFDS